MKIAVQKNRLVVKFVSEVWTLLNAFGIFGLIRGLNYKYFFSFREVLLLQRLPPDSYVFRFFLKIFKNCHLKTLLSSG